MNEDTEYSRAIRLLRSWRDLEPGEEEKARVSQRIVRSLTQSAGPWVLRGRQSTPALATSGQGLLFGFAAAAVAGILFLLTGLARPPAGFPTALRDLGGPAVFAPAGFALLVAFAAPMILVIMPSRCR